MLKTFIGVALFVSFLPVEAALIGYVDIRDAKSFDYCCKKRSKPLKRAKTKTRAVKKQVRHAR